MRADTRRSDVRRELRAWHPVLAVRRGARTPRPRSAPAPEHPPSTRAAPPRRVAALHPTHPRRTPRGWPRRTRARGARHRAVVRDQRRTTAPAQQEPPGLREPSQHGPADRWRVTCTHPRAQRDRHRVRQGSTNTRRRMRRILLAPRSPASPHPTSPRPQTAMAHRRRAAQLPGGPGPRPGLAPAVHRDQPRHHVRRAAHGEAQQIQDPA